MESAMMGLEGLGPLILETIFSKLEAKHAAVAACVCTKLKAAVSDENLWRFFCSRDFGVDSPKDPLGNPCPSFKLTYEAWNKAFGMYPLPLVKRVKQFWDGIRLWLAENFQEANETLRKGVSESELEQAEEDLGVKLPIATRLLYRFCDGQDSVDHDNSEHRCLAPLGIIGGYSCYEHLVNVHLLPLSHIVEETRDFADQIDFSIGAEYIIVATSSYYYKWFLLNCANGQLYVGTNNLLSYGEMMPCVPQALINPWPYIDALLLWLEEHSRRLQSGMIQIRKLGNMRGINLYPEAPPACSTAVTNGVQVRSSALFVPEISELNEGDEKYFYSYSIRLCLLPEGCIVDHTYYSSCQLFSRHWIFQSTDDAVKYVSGEAVIGKYPLLSPNEEEFVYESRTHLKKPPGSVEGSFTFVPGSLSKPKGRQFDVRVAQFQLEVPEYIF